MKNTHLIVLSAMFAFAANARAQITNQDDCANSGVDDVGPGVFQFDNGSASTGIEGQNEAACYKFGSSGIDNDIWLTYTATSTGLTTFSTCGGGTNTDTKIAVWPSTTPCPADGTVLACNDDTCGLYSSVSTLVTDGTSYLVQIGNFPTVNGGTGLLDIAETPPPPPSGGMNCFSDRTAFLAACGPPTDSEDFSGFTVDTPFDVPGGLNIGASMTIEAINPTGFRNLVEVPPFEFTDNNGTNHASCWTNQDAPGTDVLVTFGAPVGGFGMDVSFAAGGEVLEIYVESGGVALFACTVAGNGIDQFIGFGGGVMFDTIRMRSLNLNPGGSGEGFAADNFVVCDGGPVPIGQDPGPPCVANANSTGLAAELTAFGSISVGAMDVRLSADNIPTGYAGIFFASRTLGFIPNPGGSQGNICVLGNQGRYNAVPQIFLGAGIGNPVPAGGMQVGNLPVPTAPAPGECIMPGETWHWQVWHRDAGNGTNFSNALSITFIP